MIQIGDMVRVKTKEEILSMSGAYVNVFGNVLCRGLPYSFQSSYGKVIR